MNNITNNINKIVLVLGANAGQMDLIKYMKSIGWTVHVSAHRASDPGASEADVFHLIDISNIELVKELAEQIKADLVYSVSSDIAIKTAIAVSEHLSLPHFFNNDLVKLFDSKQLLRDFLNKENLSFVKFKKITNINEKIDWHSFPCIVKPSDAQGQRGVKKVNKTEDLSQAIKGAISASNSKVALVEEYLDGVEMSCNLLIHEGKFLFDILSERWVYTGELMGIPKGHMIPCVNVNEEVQHEALQLVHDIVKALNIGNGCLYFQMKATSTGVKIIEIAPRLDGCHMWRLIKHTTGKDLLAASVQCLLGNLDNKSSAKVRAGVNSELIFQHTAPKNIFNANNFPIPKDAIYHEYRYKDGEKIIPINGKMDVVGYYVRNYSQPEAQKFKHED